MTFLSSSRGYLPERPWFQEAPRMAKTYALVTGNRPIWDSLDQ
jgi:hypothetical protein